MLPCRLTVALLTLAFLVAAPIATAGTRDDGNKLLDDCEHVDQQNLSAPDAFSASYCLGLMHGITSTNSAYRYIFEDPISMRPLFCGPQDGIPNGEAARIVVKYLRDHPEELQKWGPALAYDALEAAFPCPASPLSAR